MSAIMTGPQPGDKALTIRQPAAQLIIAGCKAVENRRWPMSYRGRLYVHAAKSPPVGGWSDYIDGEPIGPDEAVEVEGASLPPWSALALGAIIGSVDAYDCVRLAKLPKQLRDDPFTVGPWCFLLRDPRPLAVPIPARGQLNLWTYRGPTS